MKFLFFLNGPHLKPLLNFLRTASVLRFDFLALGTVGSETPQPGIDLVLLALQGKVVTLDQHENPHISSLLGKDLICVKFHGFS